MFGGFWELIYGSYVLTSENKFCKTENTCNFSDGSWRQECLLKRKDPTSMEGEYICFRVYYFLSFIAFDEGERNP